MPMKKVCMAKPPVRWEGGSLSPTKARKGSMLIFIDASIIQSSPAAIHSTEEFGMRNNARDASKAPTKKKGLLLTQRGCHVRSLRYPIMGCTRKPVMGAAIQRM